MISSAGEVVDLVNPVKITDHVEEWLGTLEKEMRICLDDLLKSARKQK